MNRVGAPESARRGSFKRSPIVKTSSPNPLHGLPLKKIPIRRAVNSLILLAVSILNLNCSKSSTSTGGGGGDNRVFTATVTGGSFGSGGTFNGCTSPPGCSAYTQSYTFFGVYANDYALGCTRDMAIALPLNPRTGTYPLGPSPGLPGYVVGIGHAQFNECVANGAYYITDANHVGTVTVTSFNASTQTISGTFRFSAVDPNRGLTVSVTSGVFTGILPF